MGVVYSSPSLAEQTDEQTNKQTHTAAPIVKLAPASGLDGPARPGHWQAALASDSRLIVRSVVRSALAVRQQDFESRPDGDGA